MARTRPLADYFAASHWTTHLFDIWHLARPPARAAVAAEYTGRQWPVTSDRVLITAGTSEGIELVLSAIVDPASDVLVPMPTYPLYTAVLAKLGTRAVYYRTDPGAGRITFAMGR